MNREWGQVWTIRFGREGSQEKGQESEGNKGRDGLEMGRGSGGAGRGARGGEREVRRPEVCRVRVPNAHSDCKHYVPQVG